MQRPDLRAAVVAMGQQLGMDVLGRCTKLFADEQEPLAAALPPSLTHAVYGPDPRHRLDLYVPQGTCAAQPPC